MTKMIEKPNFKIETTYPLDEDIKLSYEIDTPDYGTAELYAEMGRLFDISGCTSIPQIVPVKLRDGSVCTFKLSNVGKTGNKNKRWLIEWYNGEYNGYESDDCEAHKVGEVHREIFREEEKFVERMSELEALSGDVNIVVGTYECTIKPCNVDYDLLG